tara:strand:+ start:257 stop:970 length:714 start_codon:yes stop_codon:yes gene_type:complete
MFAELKKGKAENHFRVGIIKIFYTMEKIFTILCAGILTVSLSAQTTDAGTFLLEGNGMNLEMGTVSSMEAGSTDLLEFVDKATINRMTLGVLGGYFMMDGLAVGLSIDYSSEGTKTSYTETGWDDDESKQVLMMIAPTVRYYIGETGAFAQLKYGFGNDTDKAFESGEDDDVTKMSALTIGGGYAIGLGDYVSLNPMLSYSMWTMTDEYTGSGSGDDVVTKVGALNFGLGITMYLGN